MSTDTNRTRRRVLFAAAGAVLALAVVASPAGAGVGDFFKLGQTNTADATSLLTGTTAGPQLWVSNANGDYAGIKAESAGGFAAAVYGLHSSAGGTGAGVQGISQSTEGSAVGVYGLLNSTTPGAGSAAVWGQNNGTGFSGYGVYGFHAGVGIGVFGRSPKGLGVYGNGARGGSFAGTTGAGLEGYSPANDGVRASSRAANKSGLWAHHDGSNFGYGLFAQSQVGPAIGMSGPDAGQAPITLNGKPFPSATAGYKDTEVQVTHDGTFQEVASLNVGPGTYALIAKANARAANSGLAEESYLPCRLSSGGDFDQTLSTPDGIDWETVSFVLFHSSPWASAVTLSCSAKPTEWNALVRNTKIMAIRVAGGTNTAMP